MRESQIEAHLVQRVKELGGEVRKVKWIGRKSAPDRLVMLPGGEVVQRTTTYFKGTFTMCRGPRSFWAEIKAPGKKPTAAQAREHERMRAMGQRVEVVDSIERVEEVLG